MDEVSNLMKLLKQLLLLRPGRHLHKHHLLSHNVFQECASQTLFDVSGKGIAVQRSLTGCADVNAGIVEIGIMC